MKSTKGCSYCNHTSCVSKVPIFSSLDERDARDIAALIEHRNYQKGDILLKEGDRINSITIINKGSVKAYKYTPDGREQILYILGEGDFFGERSLLSSESAAFYIEALDDVGVCVITKERFHSLLYTHPDIAISIIDELGKRISAMENAFQSMSVRNLDARIALLLLDYANRYGIMTKDGVKINLPISREGMANQLGIARETMSRKLSQLEKKGVILSENNRVLIIKKMDILDEMAGI